MLDHVPQDDRRVRTGQTRRQLVDGAHVIVDSEPLAAIADGHFAKLDPHRRVVLPRNSEEVAEIGADVEKLGSERHPAPHPRELVLGAPEVGIVEVVSIVAVGEEDRFFALVDRSGVRPDRQTFRHPDQPAGYATHELATVLFAPESRSSATHQAAIRRIRSATSHRTPSSCSLADGRDTRHESLRPR